MDRLSSFAWRPRTTVFLLGGFGVVLIALVVAFIVTNFKPTTQVWINAAMYTVQLANNEAERTRGLSGVEDLGMNGGLLMQFPEDSECGIWMQDMLIPLDIVWLNQDKTVIFLKKNVSPDLGTSTVMRPKEPCRYVLELPAGSIDKAGIRSGHQATFTVNEAAQ